MFDGAPFHLTEFMSLSRFKDITSALRYTNTPPPPFQDKFHDVRLMLQIFNEHYVDQHSPSWLNVLDESMNTWLNKWCPGFMCVPRKPHPFGNEYHSIADGDGGKPIMWRVKLQEGKDRPKDTQRNWAFPSEFESRYFKTASLMLEMTVPIHNTGKVVTMDSGFCVTAGILAMHDHGVYGQSLIKKHGRYWPKHVPGDHIDDHFKGKELGYTETYKQEVGGKQFLVHCTKNVRYVTKIMSTHGLINKVADHRTYRQINGEWKSFKYADPMSRHNKAKY